MAFKPYNFRYTDNSGLAAQQFKTACKSALQDVGKLVSDDANRRAPVGETGELSRSYTYKSEDKRVTIGSPLNYAPYVELGTGPHYTKPPQWMQNFAPRGQHGTDPWWYMGNDGEWHLGWFVTARPHLGPAVTENTDKIREAIKKHLKGK